MKTIEKIYNYISKNNSATGIEIANHLDITRQAVNKHLKVLITKGEIQKAGNTKGAVYFLPGTTSDKLNILSFKRIYEIKKLNEDIVFEDINNHLNLKKNLRSNVFEIIQYGFTEILNNAIDHSESERSVVQVHFNPYDILITIRDYGIGIYYSIYTKFGLNDEYEAVAELLKGKTTTMRERHSGEGIFFTSKALERSTFRSHRTKLTFLTKKDDVIIEEQKHIAGTEVNLQISRNSRKKLNTIFDKYAPEEFEYSFQRTKVYVKLYSEDLISRSEARRMLTGLYKFKEIILDFKDVKKIGQGFTDEIFRVFLNRYPEIRLKTENISPPIKQMIKHVVDKYINF